MINRSPEQRFGRRTPAHPPEGKLVHVERMQMRYSDMDALGHMNNTVYFRYLEQARIVVRQDRCDYRRLPEAILGSIACRFIVPIVYPADLEVTLLAGTASAHSPVQRDPDAAEGAPCARRGSDGWIDLKDGKSRPLPRW
jgi:acyl-CoA thioester hydrolase